MKLRLGLIIALVLAAALPASAAGLFTYPAATTANMTGGYNCIPNDINGPGAPSPSLGGGAPPQTVCATPGQLNTASLSNVMSVYSNIPIGSVALASLGTNTADVAAKVFIASLQLPVDKAITGIGCLQGGTATTDKTIFALYNSSGTLLANSALAGTTLSGASTFQRQAFVTAVTEPAGLYYVSVQGNGTAAGAIATIAASTYLQVATGSVTGGAFGTLPAITPPTTFTADVGPICYVY